MARYLWIVGFCGFVEERASLLNRCSFPSTSAVFPLPPPSSGEGIRTLLGHRVLDRHRTPPAKADMHLETQVLP